MNLISSTYARNNLSQILNEVTKEGKRFILIRESQPQAAIIPYTDLIEQEKEWQLEFQRLMQKSRSSFLKFLQKQKIKEKDLTEKKLYEFVNKTAGRY